MAAPLKWVLECPRSLGTYAYYGLNWIYFSVGSCFDVLCIGSEVAHEALMYLIRLLADVFELAC
jgi:hypothetical protein